MEASQEIGKYKLLDCNRKGVLCLPSSAVHLWLCYYMHESEAQESWLSLSKITATTGMSRNTVIKWQRYLVEHGWLVLTGDMAAQRYSRPSNGAWKVPVVRVDDPTKGGSISEPGGSKNEPPKNCTQGSYSGSGSDSGFSSGFDYALASSSNSNSNYDKNIIENQGDKTSKPENPKTQTPPPVVRKANPKHNGKSCWEHGLPIPCRECYRGRDIRGGRDEELQAQSNRGNLKQSSNGTSCSLDAVDEFENELYDDESDPDFWRECNMMVGEKIEDVTVCEQKGVHPKTIFVVGRERTVYYCEKHWKELGYG